MSVFDFNQRVWGRLVKSGNRWAVRVTSEDIANATGGDWQLVLPPFIASPTSWFATHRLLRPLPLIGRVAAGPHPSCRRC